MTSSEGVFKSNPGTIVGPLTRATAILAALEFGAHSAFDADSQAAPKQVKGHGLLPAFLALSLASVLSLNILAIRNLCARNVAALRNRPRRTRSAQLVQEAEGARDRG